MKHTTKKYYEAAFVLMVILTFCFAGIDYLVYADMMLYKEHGTVATATYKGSASYATPSIIENQYSTASVVFSTGDVLKGNFKVHFVDVIEDYVNSGYTKTLVKGAKVNIIYLKEKPEEDVLFEAFMKAYFERSFWRKYGVNFILMVVAFILWKYSK